MPLMPGEAEGVAASNAREAASAAQSKADRLEQRLKQLEALLGLDTRNDREKLEDHFAAAGVRVEFGYRRWLSTRERNPTPCMVRRTEDGHILRAATWEELLKMVIGP